MEQEVLPEGGVFRVSLVHALKELLQRDAEGVPNPPVGAVGLQAAPLAAGTGQPAGLHAQVAELGAAPVVPAIDDPVGDERAAHAVFQGEVGQILLVPPHEPLGVSAAGGVIFHIGGVWDGAGQTGQLHIAQVHGGGVQKMPSLRVGHARHGNAHPQQPAPVDVVGVQKLLQLPGHQGAQLLHLKVGGVRHLVVGDLVQAQVCGGETEPVLRQRDAHRHPGVGDDGQTAGLAPAGGLGLPGVAHQPGVHQIRQVLINGGQAQVQGLGQGLPGAELLGAVQVVVYVAAGLPPAFI